MNIKLLSLFLTVCLVTGGISADRGARSAKADAPDPVSAVPATAASVKLPSHWAQFWSNPEFVKSFMGAYGVASEVEPKMSADEQTFYSSLRPLLQDDPSKAIRELQSKIRPESSALLNFLLASLYFQSDQPAQAIAQYEAAVAKFPSFRRAHKNLGFALVQSGAFEKAITHLTRTIELGGADSGVLGLLGFSYLSLERHLSAESAYRNALLYAPDNLDWKLGLVKSQIATGNHKPAAELLDELIAKYPEKESLWTLQAGLFLQMEEPIKAALNYEILRKLGKADGKTLSLLGDIYMAQEQRDLALSAYLAAWEADRGGNPSRVFRAVEILASQAAWDEAVKLLTHVREKKSDLTAEDQSRLLKLEARIALATDREAEGAAMLEKVITSNPLDGQALIMLGEYFSRQGEPEKADYRFELASRISGFEAEAMVKRAQLLVSARKYAQAAELLRRAQKINPRDHVQRYLEKVESIARSAGTSS